MLEVFLSLCLELLCYRTVCNLFCLLVYDLFCIAFTQSFIVWSLHTDNAYSPINSLYKTEHAICVNFVSMLPSWQQGIVKQIEQVTHNTRRFWVELPEVEAFHFRPGQFVTLDLPIHEQRNKRWRSYSIASMPDGTNLIELLIVNVEGGAGSGYLFDEIKEGSTLTLRGPQGVFVLPEPSEKELFLICTGTGVAPFRSMVAYLHRHKLEGYKINLIFGTRTQADLLYHDELSQLQEHIPGFRYLPTLSREQWDGASGYVHDIYEQLCAERQQATFMLCGWKQMIDEARERILNMGYDKKDVQIEIYG